MKDYYKILGLERSAKQIDIRRAYRQKARHLHPDVNKSETAHEDFIELTEAYQVLKSPRKKVRYDKILDLHLSGKTYTSEKKVNRRKRWESKVKNYAKQGRAKGDEYYGYSQSKFKKKNESSAFWDFLSFIGEIFGEILSGILTAGW